MLTYISKYNERNSEEYNSPTEPSYIPVVIYRRDKGEVEVPLSVIHNGEEIGTLVLNDFIEFQYNENEDASVCVEGECWDINYNNIDKLFLECGKSLKSGVYMKRVTDDHGGFYLNKIKYHKEKRTNK